MSYDMGFDCGELKEAHSIAGGTYAVGGTTEPWINITWNYAPHFYRLWPDGGIRSLYGKKASEIVKAIDAVLPELCNDASDDYWAPTEENAKRALEGLKKLASIVPQNSLLQGD